MRRKISWLVILPLAVVILAGCGGATDDPDARIATRVAEDRAVAATLTAEAAAATGGDEAGNDAASAGSTTAGEAQAAEAATATPTDVATATRAAQAAANTPPTTAPTSTPAATPTETPTPVVATVVPALTAAPTNTPTPIVAAVIPTDGSDGEGREILLSEFGRAIILPGFPASAVTTPVVFRNFLTARVKVFDTRQYSQQDGAGIASVTFDVVGPRGEYQKIEAGPAFCLFGGNDPACPGIDLRREANDWPDGLYSTTITIVAEDDGLESQWFWQFCVNTCGEEGGAATAGGEIVAQIVETAPGSRSTSIREALAFQVEAYDEAVGSEDGAGIANVVLQVLAGDGSLLHARQENNAAYCAFGGDRPCPAWNFGENDNRWPSGEPIQSGLHTLRAVVTTDNNEQVSVDLDVTIELAAVEGADASTDSYGGEGSTIPPAGGD